MRRKIILGLLILFLFIIVIHISWNIPHVLKTKYESDFILGSLAVNLRSYVSDSEGFFPDEKTWEKISRKIPESETVHYIPSQKQLGWGGYETSVIAWRKENDKIFFITAPPLYHISARGLHGFKYDAGELPDFYPHWSAQKRSPSERLKDIIAQKTSAGSLSDVHKTTGQTILLLQLMLHDNKNALERIRSNPLEINIADPNGITPLMRAVSIQDIDLVNMLINSGANKDNENIWGDTALDIALRTKNKKIISLLKENK